MITESIIIYIPQRPPFVMVDNLLFADEEIARTNFTVAAENIFSEDGHFSEAGMLENIAQTAAAGAGYMAIKNKNAVAVGYIAAVKNFEIFFLPEINNVLTTETTKKEIVFNMIVVSGKVWSNAALAAQCELKFVVEPIN